MLMLRFFPVAVCTFLFSFMAFSANAESLVIYGDDRYPPLIYLDNDQPAGILPAIFARLTKDTGDSYELVLLPWKRALQYAERGKGGITNISRNKAREVLYDFSVPMYDDDIILVVLQGHEFDFNTLKDLQDKKLGGLYGASYGEGIDHAISNGELLVERDNGQQPRLLKLLAGRIDVAIIGNGVAGFEHILASDPQLEANRSKFLVLQNPLVHDPLHLAFSKTMHMQPALERFNKALTALRETAEYQQLIGRKP
ncbi:substrate-binding periplasmic protein [Pseudomonas sp.]|uniref:substrate-binding periplasmic protein n=1 Tax=Pseudomonas sp. TaxID=306 RepID=UPI002B8AAEA6|nr:transporter substrate-binding domain-containing protein [Pseudomonas sp.]HUE94778.1 transporter substrate-binding domain-containing protein [Pseudomonas sp.]